MQVRLCAGAGRLDAARFIRENVKEEIVKLQKVVLVKENEIITLDQTIAALNDTRRNIQANAKRDKEVYTVNAQQNEAIIKRKDKLNVDLQQKNEVMQIQIVQTQDNVMKGSKKKSELERKVKELTQ